MAALWEIAQDSHGRGGLSQLGNNHCENSIIKIFLCLEFPSDRLYEDTSLAAFKLLYSNILWLGGMKNGGGQCWVCRNKGIKLANFVFISQLEMKTDGFKVLSTTQGKGGHVTSMQDF